MRRPGNYTCQTILHMLKFQDILGSNVMINGITIVKSTANKSSCNSFGDSKTYIPANMTKVTKNYKSSNDKFVKYDVQNFNCYKR